MYLKFYKNLVYVFSIICTVLATNISTCLVLTNCGNKQTTLTTNKKNQIDTNTKNANSKQGVEQEKINKLNLQNDNEYLNWLAINNNRENIFWFLF